MSEIPIPAFPTDCLKCSVTGRDACDQHVIFTKRATDLQMRISLFQEFKLDFLNIESCMHRQQQQVTFQQISSGKKSQHLAFLEGRK